MIIFIFLFVVTAAGVVPCGSPKKRPRTSSIVQFIFYVWSFEIRRNILRNQKILSLYFYLLSLRLVLCRVAALKSGPYIVHSAVYILRLVL